jgi:hypothetical protein
MDPTIIPRGRDCRAPADTYADAMNRVPTGLLQGFDLSNPPIAKNPGSGPTHGSNNNPAERDCRSPADTCADAMNRVPTGSFVAGIRFIESADRQKFRLRVRRIGSNNNPARTRLPGARCTPLHGRDESRPYGFVAGIRFIESADCQNPGCGFDASDPTIIPRGRDCRAPADTCADAMNRVPTGSLQGFDLSNPPIAKNPGSGPTHGIPERDPERPHPAEARRETGRRCCFDRYARATGVTVRPTRLAAFTAAMGLPS